MTIQNLGAAFILGGLIIAFGAVGGMEYQPEASLILQCLAAISGLSLMYVGTKLIKE